MASMKKSRPARTTRYIPVEIISDILLRLPMKDLAKFRYVSKSWQALISNPRFVLAHSSKHPPEDEEAEEDVLYAIKNRLNGKYEYTYFSINLQNEKARPKHWPVPYASKHGVNPKELLLWSSCNGLLLYSHLYNPNQLYISNPLTAEFVALPTIRQRRCEAKWALVHDDRKKRYKVYGISSHGNYFLLTQGDDTWVVEDIFKPRKRMNILSKIFFVKNQLYWLTSNVDKEADREHNPSGLGYHMFSLDVESGRVVRTKIYGVERIILGGAEETDYLLSEVNGSLCFVIVRPDYLDIHVENKELGKWILKEWASLLFIAGEAPVSLKRGFLSKDACLVATKRARVDKVTQILKLLVHGDGWLYIYDSEDDSWGQIRSPSHERRLSGYYVFHSSSLASWKLETEGN